MPNTSFEFSLFHDFPPFYTRQPTPSSWESQKTQWSDLILGYTHHHRIFKLDLLKSTAPGGSELFENQRIQRRLSVETLRDIIQCMVDKGTAEWEDKHLRQHVYIYWYGPDKWASLIWQWVNANGLNNTIVTLYELTEGELTEDQEFHGMDTAILVTCLKVLVQQGLAQLLQGTDNGMGVKFLHGP
ncbi:vacuolar protein-sorting-associated protein 25 [Spinellus fusiger]|nr:vacuolar protein-sorting-associated protein 25 [Spinellus fusiger]